MELELCIPICNKQEVLLQILLNRMSQVNHFEQEQQTEPDHANNVNQTECPVTNKALFHLSEAEIEPFLKKKRDTFDE